MYPASIKKKLQVAIAAPLLLAACNQSGAKENSPERKPRKDSIAVKKDTLVSISGFWMDSSEISSNEYREYHWDSVNTK